MILFGNQQNRAQYKPETVTIGTQTWCLYNFAESTLIDGTVLTNVTDNSAWAALTSAAWCNYNNDPAVGAVYGKLYNWWVCALIDAAYTPFGWRTPTNAEWTTLVNYLGGATVAGGKLKETGLSHWITPNTGADNSSGFTAFGAGRRTNTGTYTTNKQYSYIVTSNNISGGNCQTLRLEYNTSAATLVATNANSGLSLRLIKI